MLQPFRRQWVIVLIHIIGWILFLSLPYIFQPGRLPAPPMPAHFQGIPNVGGQKFFAFNFMNSAGIRTLYVLLFIYFYANAYWLMPSFFRKKRYVLFAGITVSLMLIFMFIPEIVNYFYPLDPIMAGRLRRPGMMSLFLFLVIFLISSGIYITRQWLMAEERSRAIEHDKVANELAFLRAQINPHFLFNTLNNIYSLAVSSSANTAPAVLKLSDMMRYVVTEAQKDHVPLSREIDYLQYFIELQKMRLTDKVGVIVSIEGNVESLQIAPLLLISFVENAFKHGISATQQTTIRVIIKIIGKQLDMFVSNKIYSPPKTDDETSSGTGLRNVQRRLKLLYPEKHTLEILEHDQQFNVHLTLDLI